MTVLQSCSRKGLSIVNGQLNSSFLPQAAYGCVLIGRSEGKIEETNVNFIQNMYVN